MWGRLAARGAGHVTPASACRDESRHGRHECLRHVATFNRNGLFRRQGRGPCRSLFETAVAQGLPAGGNSKSRHEKNSRQGERQRGRGSWFYLAIPYGSEV